MSLYEWHWARLLVDVGPVCEGTIVRARKIRPYKFPNIPNSIEDACAIMLDDDVITGTSYESLLEPLEK